MSIVSVYCKCLLRLAIVSVYCKCLLCFRSNMLKNHLFYAVPLGNDETAWVVLRFRSKMLLFECVLLCFRSHMCKQHYKTNQNSCFLHFMHFRIRILTKNATCWSEHAIKPMVFQHFGAKTL